MSKIFFDSGISMDGFLAGDNRGPENPLGDNGPSIHNWIYKQKAFLSGLGMEGGEDGNDNKIIEETFARTGSYIMGKRMFEEGEKHWPEDLYKADVYVLTHEKREPWVQKGTTTFYFIKDGLKSAVEKARKSANNRDIRIQGGAETIQQFINAGLIDEFTLHFTPILLGSGIRLFENLDWKKFNISIDEVIPSQLTTHIWYKIINK